MVQVDCLAEPELQIPTIANLPFDTPIFEEHADEFTPHHKENLREVCRNADREAEKQDRRDCIRIQSQIEKFRRRFDIPE